MERSTAMYLGKLYAILFWVFALFMLHSMIELVKIALGGWTLGTEPDTAGAVILMALGMALFLLNLIAGFLLLSGRGRTTAMLVSAIDVFIAGILASLPPAEATLFGLVSVVVFLGGIYLFSLNSDMKALFTPPAQER